MTGSQLPARLGIPQKWCGYTQCPRPKVRAASGSPGIELKQSPFCLPEYLESGRSLKAILPSDKPAGTRLLPIIDIIRTHAKFNSDLNLIDLESNFESVRTNAGLVSLESDLKREALLKDNPHGKLLESLRRQRIPTKGRFQSSQPPYSNGELYLKEKTKYLLSNPHKAKISRHLDELDKKNLLKKRMTKYPVYFSQKSLISSSLESSQSKSSTSSSLSFQ